MPVSAIEELDALQSRGVPVFVDRMRKLVRAVASDGDVEGATESLADLIASSTGIADILGRRRTLLQVDRKAGRKVQFGVEDERAISTPQIIEKVTFQEALDNIVQREPRLVESAEEVRQLYTEGKFFALARARADESGKVVTERVQGFIADAIRRGVPDSKIVADIMAQSEDFTRAYAETVLSTNLTTAYTEGRFAQARSPELRDFIVALRFTATGPPETTDTRPNHWAADGLMAAPNDPIWDFLRPPLGYR